ncbi:pyridoxamine 5'-phosphate oxidase family protein [Maribacter halichondriae]|uniref:pyridoxamine 5'-phosphate oxidase family protein n=1 Tax=Maribacter halichondriae TaxID=2980554 RepID=UPI002358ABF0|nr:pyridoxamine 5'-phosphate oxidase family protein [Maribacter sp. Hal144]
MQAKKMKLTTEIKEYINRSVLCWLASVSTENVPNVSPKEIFNYYGTDKIIIANIASPQTIRNIRQNENVCLSFIDILVQKGFQLKGKARIIGKTDSEFLEMEKILTEMTGGNFPFATITEITLVQVKPIIAPKYMFYPETTEAEQIESAKKRMEFKTNKA